MAESLSGTGHDPIAEYGTGNHIPSVSTGDIGAAPGTRSGGFSADFGTECLRSQIQMSGTAAEKGQNTDGRKLKDETFPVQRTGSVQRS